MKAWLDIMRFVVVIWANQFLDGKNTQNPRGYSGFRDKVLHLHPNNEKMLVFIGRPLYDHRN